MVRSKLQDHSRRGTSHHLAINGIDAFLWGHDHVEDEEVTLEAVGNIVLACARMVHRAHILQVFDNLRAFGQNTNANDLI